MRCPLSARPGRRPAGRGAHRDGHAVGRPGTRGGRDAGGPGKEHLHQRGGRNNLFLAISPPSMSYFTRGTLFPTATVFGGKVRATAAVHPSPTPSGVSQDAVVQISEEPRELPLPGQSERGRAGKGVDVSLALDLMRATYQRQYETATIVSQDWDFGPELR